MKKGIALDEVIKRQLKKSPELQLEVEQRRFYLQVAHLITELRSHAGISQSDLAKRAGVSQPLIARLEKGDQHRTPTLETLMKVLKALGYSLSLAVKPENKRHAA